MHENEIYRNLRRTQAWIVRQNVFLNGELFEIVNRKTFIEYARILCNKYFHKTKNIEIYSLIFDLYRIFLVLAPIIQKIPYSFKLDWTRGHFLSFIRIYTNKKINRKFLLLRELKREIDINKLQTNLIKLGIKDIRFVNFIIDCFRQNYGLLTLRGKLANCIFDPIMFFTEKNGFEIRFQNKFLKLEKRKFPGAVNIDEEPITVWDYKLKRVIDLKTKKTTLNIEISDEYIRKFKDRIKGIINSRASPQRKILLIHNKLNSFLEIHKYTKDCFDQIIEFKYWLNGKTKGIAAQDRRVKEIINNFPKRYNDKVITKLLIKKPNFFWDSSLIDENVYKNYFSPYREG